MSTQYPVTTPGRLVDMEISTVTTPPAKGACRETSKDFFELTDEYDAYDDFDLSTGASGGGGGSSSNKTEKRANSRGHSGSQGPYSSKHNRLRAERPKTQPKKGAPL